MEEIWKDIPRDDLSRVMIKSAFSDRLIFNNFQSTINRLSPFFEGSLENMFASTKGTISFQELIRQKYLILVTMKKSQIGKMGQQLLGTVIVNYLIRAKERLFETERNEDPYHLYIDEIGQFATEKIEDILDHNRHIGIRLVMAHQRYHQLGEYESAIKSAASKILFYSSEPNDRLKSVQMMFGGDVADRDAAYYASTLKKQHVIIKLGKQPPVTTRFHDSEVPEVSSQAVKSFLNDYVYNQAINPFYKTEAQVEGEKRKRFANAQFAGGRPVRHQESSEQRHTSQRSPDRHSGVQAPPVDQRAGEKESRTARLSPQQRPQGVPPTLVHKREPVSGEVGRQEGDVETLGAGG